MGEVLPFPNQALQHSLDFDYHFPAPLIYLDPEERLEAAYEDMDMRAFCELRKLGYTDLPLSDNKLDALHSYPQTEMINDLCLFHGVTQKEASEIIDEYEWALCEAYGKIYSNE